MTTNREAFDATEPTGLVCGMRVLDGSLVEEVRWGDMDRVLNEGVGVVWLHFNQSDARVRDWIQATPHLPARAKTILLASDAHMRIEVSGDGLTGTVGDLHHTFTEKSDHMGVLRLYLDNHKLISTRRSPLQSVDKLRQAIGSGRRFTRPVIIIADFLHHVTDTLGDLLVELAGEVDELEEQLLGNHVADATPRILRVRRVALRLRRHMVPQQHALISLTSKLPSWIDEDCALHLRGAVERLSALGHDLDLVQERARLVGDQISNRLLEATNRNLYTLSIVTTVFLPMTLVTGIFGMNLGGLPGQQDGNGFWYGIFLMLALGAATYVWLRRRELV